MNGWEDKLHMTVGAVSSQTMTLHMPHVTSRNFGGLGVHAGDEGIAIQARRIDEIMDLERPVHVMKMDVEGHEYQALQGMEHMFQKRLVNNVVMEFSPNVMPFNESVLMLEYLHEHGFKTIYEIDFEGAEAYNQPLKKHLVDTKSANWAHNWARNIADGGDGRHIGQTDIILSLL